MKATTTTPKNVYQMVTDRIIAQMEQGIIPWRRPWHGLNNANPAEVAISYETRRAYSDDCYAVNDFDLVDVRLLKQIADSFCGVEVTPNGWQHDKWRTANVLRAGGYPQRNCTTHLPQWYEWDKWEAIVQRYDMTRQSYTIEDLYYNIYFPDRVFFQLTETDNLKFGLYEEGIEADRIRRVMKRKIWLTNSPVGWSDALDEVLREHYGL